MKNDLLKHQFIIKIVFFNNFFQNNVFNNFNSLQLA